MENQKDEIKINRRLEYLDITIGALLGLLVVIIIGTPFLNPIEDPYASDPWWFSVLLQMLFYIGILTTIMVGPFYYTVRYIKPKFSLKNQKFFSYYAFITVSFLIYGVLITYDIFVIPSLIFPFVLLAVSCFTFYSN